MERAYLGLDAGGTKVAAGVVTERGAVRSHVRLATAELRANGQPLAALVALGRRAIAEAGGGAPDGVGVALPGPVRRADLTMLAAPTIPEWERVPLGPALCEAFGAPAAGDNDANACALAESRFGAGAGAAVVVYFTVSTGIGGGIVVDGRVFRGARGTSGEFGHQVILPEGGPLCDCGNRGCLEALASGRGIAARARQTLAPPAVGGEWTAETIAHAARSGDPTAVQVWRDTALYLGLGISNVVNVIDPDVVVLGGGVVAGAGDLLLDPVREVVAARCMPSLARGVRIVPAALRSDVGIIGAACLAMEAGIIRDEDVRQTRLGSEPESPGGAAEGGPL